MGRKVGAKRKPRASSRIQLLHEATVAWNRRMTLLSFSAQVCGPDTHPDEVTRFAGTFESFVLEGTVPAEPSGEVVSLKVTPKPITTPTLPLAPSSTSTSAPPVVPA
jgi:hypothetical protein